MTDSSVDKLSEQGPDTLNPKDLKQARVVWYPGQAPHTSHPMGGCIPGHEGAVQESQMSLPRSWSKARSNRVWGG